jgi:WD40 repeat protein/tRNA A-37 threonylcarbamoyl transferase component Bud32
MTMNVPKPGDTSMSEQAERLLAYDAALATGVSPSQVFGTEPPDDLREGFSCLEMLERYRLLEPMTPEAAPAEEPTPLDLPENEANTDPSQLGRFQMLSVLGRGGCGLVFLAYDPALQRRIALKIPRAEALVTQELRQRFIREGRVAAGLEHPNLVTVFEAGEVGALCYLASAYCPGITLRDWLRKQGNPVAPRAAAVLIGTLARAMHYAHQKGVCHRDLKPSNILLQQAEAAGVLNLDNAIPKIIDFGLAKQSIGDPTETGTRTGVVLGTPQYMAPEQAEGKNQVIGPASDIHALGVILYELLTRRPPFQGDSDIKILNQVASARPESPRRFRPNVPRDLETICLKCLEKEPVHRYASMADLADDLQRFAEGHPIRARRPGWMETGIKWVRRQPRVATAGTLLGSLVCCLVTALIWISNRDSTHQANATRALEEIDVHKARAEKLDWLARNHRYSSQIRAGSLLKKENQLGTLRDLLLDQMPGPNQKDLRGFAWHYLWRRGQGFMIPAHHGPVTAVAFSHDGRWCASGGTDGAVHVYERRTGKLLARLEGHHSEIRTLNFLPDDHQLVSTVFMQHADGSGFLSEFILWDLGAENKMLRRGDYSHHNMSGCPNLAVAADAQALFITDRRNNPLRILKLDLATGAEKLLLTDEHLGLIACTPGGDRLAIVRAQPLHAKDCSLEIVDAATMRPLGPQVPHKSVHLAEFSPDGKTLALGVGEQVNDCHLEIREGPSLRLIRSFDFNWAPHKPHFDGSGKRLTVVEGAVQTLLFDVNTGSLLWSFQHVGQCAGPLAFAPDDQEIAVGWTDGRVRIGKNEIGPQDESIPGPLPESEAWCTAFTPDGNTLAVGYDHENGSEHETLRLIDLGTKKARLLTGHEATVMALAFSPLGKTLASASHDGTVRLWDGTTGNCLHVLKGHSGPVRALAFSPDGNQIASAGSDLSIKTWNAQDGSLSRSWAAHADMIRALTYTPDGQALISAANDRTIKVWNPEDGRHVRTITDEEKVQCLACSPDGLLLASGNEFNNVKLWELATGDLQKTLAGHSGRVRSVAFSPDGKALASGGEDKTVRLWNVVTGQELLVFPTEHFVNGLAFDRKKPLLAGVLHDGTVKLWSGE